MSRSPEHAAGLIWQHWQDGTVMADLPVPQKPHTRAAGYAIQAHLEGFSAHPRAGWKIAATSQAGQSHINVEGPLAGRLLAERLLDDGAGISLAGISLAGNRMLVAEPEFAFRFGAAVPARGAEYGTDEVLGLVSALHLALELPDSRFTDFTAVGGSTLIADNACARDLVLGPEVTADWRGTDLAAHPVRCTVGSRYTRDGGGANVLGDPRAALAWCVNEISSLGIDIRPGEVITTGTCAVPLEIEAGDLVIADFGPFGRISARLTA